MATRLCAVSDVPLGKSRAFSVGLDKIALFHQPDGFFALEDTCPHRGASLAEGWVCAGRVACPLHQWEFDLIDGSSPAFPGVRVKSYPVEVRDTEIWIQL
jgi:nitrite reductase/ring-hydroxylating ferredoxin subunit